MGFWEGAVIHRAHSSEWERDVERRCGVLGSPGRQSNAVWFWEARLDLRYAGGSSTEK